MTALAHVMTMHFSRQNVANLAKEESPKNRGSAAL